MVLVVSLLDDLQARGIVVEAVADRLRVTPATALTDRDRAAIQRQRHTLLVALSNPAIDSGLCAACWPEQRRPSLCPPYGWCARCTEAAWARRRS